MGTESVSDSNQTIQEYLTIRDHSRSESVQDCPRVSKSIRECPKVSDSIPEYPRVSESIGEYLKVSKHIWECPRVSKNVQKCHRGSTCPRVLNTNKGNSNVGAHPHPQLSLIFFRISIFIQHKFICMILPVIFLNIYICAGSKQSRPSWVSPLYHPMIYDVYLVRVMRIPRRRGKLSLFYRRKEKKEVVFVSR